MNFLKQYLIVFLFFVFSACVPSSSQLWLEEYEVLLQQGVQEFIQNPLSDEMRNVQYEIAEKEAEVDGLLRNISMQEQMNFLSRYYEMRVNFYYSIQ